MREGETVNRFFRHKILIKKLLYKFKTFYNKYMLFFNFSRRKLFRSVL